MKPINKPTDLVAEDVTQVYSGRPGCACGCRGEHYRPESPSFKRMVAKVLRRIANPEPGDTVWDSNGFVVVENDRHVWSAYYDEKRCFKPATSSVE